MNAPVIHLAGHPDRDGKQRCVICGEQLGSHNAGYYREGVDVTVSQTLFGGVLVSTSPAEPRRCSEIQYEREATK